MANTLTQFPAGQLQYRVNFDYLSRQFVVLTLLNTADATMNKRLVAGNDYRFLSPTIIEVIAPQDDYDIMQIARETSSEPLVSFKDGSVLTASDLTVSELQAIHIAEEGRDQTVELSKTYADSALISRNEADEILQQIKDVGAFGYTPVGSFELGANVELFSQSVKYGSGTSTTFWRWDGELPKVVEPNSTPESSGGIGEGKWIDVTDSTLRGQLARHDGYTLIPSIQVQRWRDEGDIRGWGCKCDGATDDTLKMQQAFDESKRIKLVGNPIVSGTILIRENQNIVSDGAIVSTTSDTMSILYADNVDNWSICGNLTLERKGWTSAPTVRVESHCGIAIQDCLNFKVQGVVAQGFSGSGYYVTASSDMSRGFVTSSIISDCVANNNNVGFTTRPGFAAEYITFSSCISRYNHLYGVEDLSGNIQWSGGQVTHNTTIGFSVRQGFNDAHGNVSGTAINHNIGKAIEVVGTNNGFTFSGCSVFDNSANDGYTGGIYFDNCSGVVFSGCQLMVDIIEVATTGRNLISNCMFANAPTRPYAHTIVSGGRNVLLRGCVRAGGDNLGLRNAFGGSGIEFTLSANQIISGTAGAVIFNSPSYAFGQIQYDVSAGLVNIFHAGDYFIDLNLSATSTASNVYADVYRGSVLVASVPATLKPDGGFSVSGRIPFSAGRGESIKVEIRSSTSGVTVIGGSFIRVALID